MKSHPSFLKIGVACASLVCVSLARADSPPAPPTPPADHSHKAEDIFKKFDTNHDGVLSLDEFKTGHDKMHAMHEQRMEKRAEMREQHREDHFKKLDKNGDGSLSKDEVKDSPLANRFDQLDTNHDGKLTMDEMKAGMSMPNKMHDKHHHMEGGPKPASGSNPM